MNYNNYYRKSAQTPYTEDAIASLKRKAQGCTDPRTLLKMAKEHFGNWVICIQLADNAYSDTSVLELLAKHPNVNVRRQVAASSHKISDFKTLVLLSEDKDNIVRKNLARTCLNEQILYKLFRENFKSPEIACFFLKRTSNKAFLKSFIRKATPSVLKKFSSQILSNKNLEEEDLNELIQKDCISLIPILCSCVLSEQSVEILSRKLLIISFDDFTDDELICLSITPKIKWEHHLELQTKLYLYASKKRSTSQIL